jgi:glycosyltransferase involved in cell wall biosynthesis
LSYGSFFLNAALTGFRVPRPDLIITLTTPPLISLVGTVVKAFRRTRHFIWEMDVYPDIAVGLEYFKAGGILDRVTGMLADFSRYRCDGILSLGSCMRERLIARGIPAGKIHIAENWADSAIISPVPISSSSEYLSVLYSGNLGLAHDVDTVQAAMRELQPDGSVRFTFAGGGGQRKDLESWCLREGISIADFRPYSTRTNLRESLGSGDIGLVSQRNAALGSVVPSKVYGLLAAGRPVLFIGPKASTVAQIIRRFDCGWHVECGDTPQLVALLKELAADRGRVIAAGDRARTAFLAHYDRSIGVSRICSVIGASFHVQESTPLVVSAGELG